MKVLGIDEAGRGPVIGPLVIAGFLIDEEDIKILEDIGVKDSKLLSREKREEIFEKLIKYSHTYYIIDPKTIDYYVERKSLNLLEIKYFIKIIDNLNPDKVYLDSPSHNTKKIKEIIERKINKKNIELIVENKADRNYLVVGAASIIAKVIRDKEIDKIKDKLGIDFGSGYPSDKRTIYAIKEHYEELKDYMRETWNTIKKIKGYKQKNIKDYFSMPR